MDVSVESEAGVGSDLSEAREGVKDESISEEEEHLILSFSAQLKVDHNIFLWHIFLLSVYVLMWFCYLIF